jgi:outer membrane protein assembly factor BamE
MQRLLALMPVLLILVTGCQTSMVKQFSTVQSGMEKDDILEIMGSPTRTQRFHGKDRWTYIFYDDKIRFEKEVQFFEGNAVYVGEVSQPELEKSAFFVDKQNNEKNIQIEKMMAEDVKKHRQAVESYESKIKGADKVRYVPSFEPIQ